MPSIPVTSWDETLPLDTEARSLGDDRIREMKIQIREILEVDHEMDYPAEGQDTDWGYHNKVTLNMSASHLSSTGVFTLYSYTGSTIYYNNGTDGAIKIMDATEFTGGMFKEIRMWYGTLATIPAGWALCDGTTAERPNLLATFLRGINTSVTAPGSAGGNNALTLTESNLPSHTHTFAFNDTNTAHTHDARHGYYLVTTGTVTANPAGKIFHSAFINQPTTRQSPTDHAHSVTLSAATATSFDNRPAYYELAFIVRTSI